MCPLIQIAKSPEETTIMAEVAWIAKGNSMVDSS